MRNTTVAEVMTTDVVTAMPEMPLKDLVGLLARHRLSALPVVDGDGHVIGIVSERDLLPKQAHPLAPAHHWWQLPRTREEIRRAEGDTVGEIMTPDPVTVSPQARLAEAAGRMTEHEVKHLPVVDPDGTLLGIVSRADVIRTFLRTDDDIRVAVLDDVFRDVLSVPPTDVDVSVRDGIVTLGGTVDLRSTAQIATRLAHRVDGVVDVVSDLRYRLDDGGLEGHAARRHQASEMSDMSGQDIGINP
jgi:CBS domain-containing protein